MTTERTPEPNESAPLELGHHAYAVLRNRDFLLYLIGRWLMAGRASSFFRLFAAVGWAWLPLFIQKASVSG